MEPEIQRKVEEAVKDMLKRADMENMNQFKLRLAVSERLGLDLSGIEHKRFIKDVIDSFLLSTADETSRNGAETETKIGDGIIDSSLLPSDETARNGAETETKIGDGVINSSLLPTADDTGCEGVETETKLGEEIAERDTVVQGDETEQKAEVKKIIVRDRVLCEVKCSWLRSVTWKKQDSAKNFCSFNCSAFSMWKEFRSLYVRSVQRLISLQSLFKKKKKIALSLSLILVVSILAIKQEKCGA